MNERLLGMCLMVVEDDALLGPMVVDILEGEGAKVIGPFATTEAARAAVHDTPRIDGALLDVQLLDGTSYAVADALTELAVPYAFLSSSDPDAIPSHLRPVRFMAKPALRGDVIRMCEAVIRAGHL